MIDKDDLEEVEDETPDTSGQLKYNNVGSPNVETTLANRKEYLGDGGVSSPLSGPYADRHGVRSEAGGAVRRVGLGSRGRWEAGWAEGAVC